MQWWSKALIGVGAVAATGLVARLQATRHFVEEPEHTVVRSLGPDIEVRRYSPVIVAETRVESSYEEAPSEGFRRLAGYIFGGNRARERIAMTAPVVQAPEADEGERIAMTAPVVHASEGGAHVITFVLPAGRSLESFPVPNDARVSLREQPARDVAVLRYRGDASRARFEERAAELRAELTRAGLVAASEPTSARYDPPTTIPFLRRNEVWIELAPAS